MQEIFLIYSLRTRPADAGDDQDAYGNRQRALFGSILRGPADQWYQGLAAHLPWNEIRDQFIDRLMMIRISIEDEQKQKT